MKKLKKEPIFSGVGTALVTPFRNGKIDYPSLGALIEGQIAASIDALIVGGTTGEVATLSDKERYALYRFAADRIGGRCKLILGTGTNDTRAAVSHTNAARALGANGALVVTPYYNKGTERGLLEHYRAIAGATDLPLILYNVPSRTGVHLSMDLLHKLAKIPTIVGIKEASDSAERLISLSTFKEDLPLYAGTDAATYTVLSLGGEGVISVISNLFPRLTRRIAGAYFAQNPKEALAQQHRLLPWIGALFTETNPAPIKYAMSLYGLCSAEMRLPLAEPTAKTKRKVQKARADLPADE